jgi:uncharacterized protein
MKRLQTLIFLAAIAMPLTAAGCSSILSPRPDPTKFYVLTALAGADAIPPASAAAPHLAIGLGPVKFPDYLARPEVVTRVSRNRVELSPTDRWAEPLDESFRRVLALNLATLLGTDQVIPFPWDASAKLNYRIEVTVERFEYDASGGTDLAASWLIRRGDSDQPLLSRQSKFNARVQAGAGGISVDDAAAALSRDLTDLSKQIADAITSLDSSRPPHPTN